MLPAAATAMLLCATSEATPPPRVLVYTVSAGYEHDVVKREKPGELSLVERAMVDLGKRTGHFEAVPTRDANAFSPENLRKHALVFFYTTGELPLAADQRRALFDFVKEGGGFAGAHCATDTFAGTPEYGDMIGAYFDGHPWVQEVRVRVEDREHPATRHLGESFKIADEIYQYRPPYDRKKLHVLLSIDTSSVDLGKPEVHRKDGDFALAWCKDYDKGRVFYTGLGHGPEVWRDERFLKHLDGGLRWAMRAADEPPAKDAPKAGRDPAPPPGGKKEGEKPPRQALPLVPDGFAIDLVAEAPEILWPSSNCCLPDGSLLVGEDRMDMPGPTNEPLDRVIRLAWKEDGGFEKTVFAEHLYAVMGMAEVDGAVFVMNMPHLTRLLDADGDGVAEERTEVLTDLGPPAPGFPGGFNDHIVSGIRLGMDGYLYVAVGDKGIPGAHGTDGSTIQLRGGGVVRVRPDGSRLEIVASGLRNVLDVAIDERGEMFTYDNTDDGLGWWTRLTHVVAGGYYGYPFDYHDHQDWMLPCMAEYGGGSPTGGLVYRQAAWPEEYQGNLFFCEWAKGALRRFVLEESGATFRVQSAEDFVSAGDVPAFKPLDVCESPDGRFLYLSDWGYEGWTNPKEAGRIWRIRRADDDPKAPSAEEPLPEDVDGLVRALGDPHFTRRLRAQRELARRGEAVAPALRAVLADGAAQERRARHAFWALAGIASAVDLALQGPRDLVRQAARVAGPTAIPRILRQSDPVARREAAVAAGSVVGPEREEVARALAECADPCAEDRFLWLPWARSMRQLGIFPDLARAREPEFALLAFRGAYDPKAIDGLTGALARRLRPDFRAAVLPVLADLHRKPEPWDGKWWSIQPAKSPPPPHVLDWECTERIGKAILAQLDDVRPEVRRAALEAVRTIDDRAAAPAVRARFERESQDELRELVLDVLGALKDEGAETLLGSIVRAPDTSTSLRQRAIEAACAIRTSGMVDLLVAVAGDPEAPPPQVVPCLLALGRLKDPKASATVARRLGPGDRKIRVAAAAAIVDLEGAESASKLEPLLADAAVGVRLAAVSALGRLKLAEETPRILPLVDDESTRDEAIAALAAAPDPRALPAYLLGLTRKKKTVRDASRAALAAVRDEVRGDLEALAARGGLGEEELAAVQEIYEAPQPILAWRILGPFQRGEEPVLPGEEGAWIEHRAGIGDGFVDLVKLFSGESELTAWAAAEVPSAVDREADMAVGSDDSVAVYVRGELVHEFPGNRSWTADEDRFRVRLRAGSNRILLRVGNNTGGWSFNAKISGDPTGPLFARKAVRPDLETYRAFALEHPGDPARGFAIFRRSRDEAMCIRCHTVFGTGDAVGPELSDIGAKYGREEILNSILAPSQRIAEGYRSSSLELQDGRIVFGMVQKETRDAIELFDTNGVLQRIEKADVASRSELDTSVMPDGLWTTLAKEDLSDLLAWLATLRGAPGGK